MRRQTTCQVDRGLEVLQERPKLQHAPETSILIFKLFSRDHKTCQQLTRVKDQDTFLHELMMLQNWDLGNLQIRTSFGMLFCLGWHLRQRRASAFGCGSKTYEPTSYDDGRLHVLHALPPGSDKHARAFTKASNVCSQG